MSLPDIVQDAGVFTRQGRVHYFRERSHRRRDLPLQRLFVDDAASHCCPCYAVSLAR